MSKGSTLSIVMLAAAIATFALNMNTAIVKEAFASGGGCGSCASSFTPKSQSSSLSGSGAPGAERAFAPGQEAQATGGSASDFSSGHEKP
jgi:hypothetical protein